MIESSATPPDRASECHSLQQRYEELRAQAVGATIDQGRRGYGLCLFLDQGMVAWVKAWSTFSVEPGALSPRKPQSPGDIIEPIPGTTSGLFEFQNQLTNLLAGVALQIARTNTVTPNTATLGELHDAPQ